MKRLILLLFVVVPLCLTAQVEDNFADGDFSNNPEWSGTDEQFVVENNSLRLYYSDASINSTQAYLSTPSEAFVNGVWQFRATINTTTSSANYVRFYLTSDNSDLSAPLNGYFVMIGNTNDEICLYRQQGDEKIKIIAGSTKRTDLPSFEVTIKVYRDEVGNWQLFSKINDEYEFQLEGTSLDNNILGSRYAGIFVAYSKSNIGKYFFNKISIEGTKFVDVTAPTIIDCELIDESKVLLSFSENIATANFTIHPSENNLQSIVHKTSRSIEITFLQPFHKGVLHSITLQGVADMAGNRLLDSTATFYVPNLKDVIFNELLVDPEPQIALPNAKYIELYNRCMNDIRLKNWQLFIGKNSYSLPDITMKSNDYIIICAVKDTLNFNNLGSYCPISSLAAMTISGTIMTLFATTKECIDWVEYDESLYDSEFKKDGGWALERIDTENFSVINNWAVSVNLQGGTPFASNSVFKSSPDTIPPKIEWLAVDASDTIRLKFNKEMNVKTCYEQDNFLLQNRDVLSVYSNEASNRSFTLIISPDLIENELDTLQIDNLKDISGINFGKYAHPIGVLQNAEDYQDVIVNELLFNPRENGVDYVEIFNPTNKIWNLSNLFISNRKDGELQKRVPITLFNEQLLPMSYLVLTPNTAIVKSQYVVPQNSFFKNINLPSLPDKEGNIVLVANNGTILDEFSYNEKLHHSFIKNVEGVALERVNPHLSTQTDGNWQSAASNVGYGTPGYRNSQYLDVDPQPIKKQYFSIAYKNFSPDNDGFHDLLQINYHLPENGFVTSITIYTANGEIVKKLANNALIGCDGTLFWDGTNEQFVLCNVGIYVLYIEYLHPSGRKGQEKIICSLTSR